VIRKWAYNGRCSRVNYLDNGAIFSPGRAYRYKLWRRWSAGPVVHFIMLNPSTADEKKNDPTVERCERRARQWGYGGLIVTNIFAYRSTSPWALYKIPDPIGTDNDYHILSSTTKTEHTICGWGEHGKLMNRHEKVKTLLGYVRVYALKLNKDGIPTHPLYLNYKLEPIPIFGNDKQWKRPVEAKKLMEFV
jgi:hypothetical protein